MGNPDHWLGFRGDVGSSSGFQESQALDTQQQQQQQQDEIQAQVLGDHIPSYTLSPDTERRIADTTQQLRHVLLPDEQQRLNDIETLLLEDVPSAGPHSPNTEQRIANIVEELQEILSPNLPLHLDDIEHQLLGDEPSDDLLSPAMEKQVANMATSFLDILPPPQLEVQPPPQDLQQAPAQPPEEPLPTFSRITEIVAKQGFLVRGMGECTGCHALQQISTDLVRGLWRLRNDVAAEKEGMAGIASRNWLRNEAPVQMNCERCNIKRAFKVEIRGRQGDPLDWLFLLATQQLGKLEQHHLRWYCTSNNIPVLSTDTKERMLYLTYMHLCQQLEPDEPLFEA